MSVAGNNAQSSVVGLEVGLEPGDDPGPVTVEVAHPAQVQDDVARGLLRLHDVVAAGPQLAGYARPELNPHFTFDNFF